MKDRHVKTFAFAAVCMAMSPALRSQQAGSDAPSEATPSYPYTINHRPKLSLGWGELIYREHGFEAIDPGTESEFREKVFKIDLGWEFVREKNSIHLNFDFLSTSSGEEDWEYQGFPIQENDLGIWRAGLDFGSSWSTWDRSLPPEALPETDQIVRFAGGINGYFRHQQFERDDFFNVVVSQELDLESTEMFEMIGAELMLDLELGPRQYAAFFARGKGGGGGVFVINKMHGGIVDTLTVTSFGVQGTIEAGVVSQFSKHVELRLGYRFHHMEVFENTSEVDFGDEDIAFAELPQNTTQFHMIFLEAVIPF